MVAICGSTGAFTLNEVAAPSRVGAPILEDFRMHGLFEGLCAPIRAGYDEVGFVPLGADHLLELSDYDRFLLQGTCEGYARAGLALLPMRVDPPSLTRRETECLRWIAAARSDPKIGMILGLSSNTIHAHIEAAKTKFGQLSCASCTSGTNGRYPKVGPFTIVSFSATADVLPAAPFVFWNVALPLSGIVSGQCFGQP